MARRLRSSFSASAAGRARRRAFCSASAAPLLFGRLAFACRGLFPMLTLAFAQIAWSIAYQWVDVAGGDNGLIGVWPSAWAAAPSISIC